MGKKIARKGKVPRSTKGLFTGYNDLDSVALKNAHTCRLDIIIQSSDDQKYEYS